MTWVTGLIVLIGAGMRVVIAAGGTGGHLYPGVAIAREFQRQVPGCEVSFIGTSHGLEAKVAPREGFELIPIQVQGIMGKGLMGALRGLAALPLGFAQCVSVCRRRRPDLAIGIGGYTSPPLIGAAALLGIKRALVEPNAYPGMANRVTSVLAHLVFVAFPETIPFFGSRKTRVVGTPIRREFLESSPPGGPSGHAPAEGPTLLVLGGSQGARSINRAVVAAMPSLLAAHPALHVIHQTGERDYEELATAYRAMSKKADAAFRKEPEVAPFLYDIPRAFHQADLIISRSGATTVAEITACGKPAILIPFPYAIHGHQERNARVLGQAGAAEVILDHCLSENVLGPAILALLANRARLDEMARRSKALGRPDSAERVVRACRELVAQT